MSSGKRCLQIVVALAVSAPPSLAQSVICHPIRRGESAADVARRVTGDSRNTYRASFQIMNAASRFIPKSQYQGVRAGWRACVITPVLRRTASVVRSGRSKTPDVGDADVQQEPAAAEAPAAPMALTSTSAPIFIRISAPSSPSVPHRAGGHDLTLVWLGAAIAAPWFGLQMLDLYQGRRTSRAVLVQHFANRFISEFERPLVRYDATDPPLRSRVRRARRGRFEVLLAPGRGRRYPNLDDHRRNVEYDVARVMDALGDDAFVPGALSMQAGWLVVPFQSGAGPKRVKIT